MAYKNVIHNLSKSNFVKPILKQHNIINGMLPIEIENIDDILMYGESMQEVFTISYRFKLQNNNKNYKNNTWESKQFSLENISRDNKFWLKVPLFLLSYSMEFNVTIKTIYNEYILQTTKSKTYIANIASILIGTSYKNGDNVEYLVANAGFVRSGKVLELMENNMIKIKSDPFYGEDIIIINVSKVYPPKVASYFVIDTTNRRQAEIDLILRTNDKEKINVYCMLCDYLNSFYCDELFESEKDKQHFEGGIGFMSSLIATNIYQCLYENCKYKYRIQCVFDDSFLFIEEQWKYKILRCFHLLKNGKEIHGLKNRDNSTGFGCDICRITISWYEYMYHCQYNGDKYEDNHDFCISCIHSMIQQYNEMNTFIAEILNDTINDDCINEIVAFCVGKVIKVVTH